MKIMQGTIMGEVDGVRVLMKAGSKPPHGTRVSYFGPPYSRCGSPSQMREHDRIGHKQLCKPFYYTKWFFCIAVDCHTKAFYATNDEFKVWNIDPSNAPSLRGEGAGRTFWIPTLKLLSP